MVQLKKGERFEVDMYFLDSTKFSIKTLVIMEVTRGFKHCFHYVQATGGNHRKMTYDRFEHMVRERRIRLC
jgi:hypothetical protein